jgi:hypothetical protein
MHNWFRQNQTNVKIEYPLLYTGYFDDPIKNLGKMFTGMRTQEMPKRKQSRP